MLLREVDSHKKREYEFMKPVIEWLLSNGLECQAGCFCISHPCVLTVMRREEDAVGIELTELSAAPDGAPPFKAFVNRAFAAISKPVAAAPAGGSSEVACVIN